MPPLPSEICQLRSSPHHGRTAVAHPPCWYTPATHLIPVSSPMPILTPAPSVTSEFPTVPFPIPCPLLRQSGEIHLRPRLNAGRFQVPARPLEKKALLRVLDTFDTPSMNGCCTTTVRSPQAQGSTVAHRRDQVMAVQGCNTTPSPLRKWPFQGPRGDVGAQGARRANFRVFPPSQALLTSSPKRILAT